MGNLQALATLHRDTVGHRLKRINLLLQSIDRNGTACIGNPEPLRGNLSGWWSVRINQTDRIVFRISALTSEENVLEILQCKGHYA